MRSILALVLSSVVFLVFIKKLYDVSSNVFLLPSLDSTFKTEKAKPSINFKYSTGESIKSLATRSITDYAFPVVDSNLFIETKEIPINDGFEITLEALSKYDFFCIDNVLKLMKLKYSFYKLDKKIILYIDIKDEKILANVLSKLDSYEIIYTTKNKYL